MSKSKKSKKTSESLEKARRRKRASYIRTKLAEGKPTDEEEREFLAAYDAEPHGNATPIAEPDAPSEPTESADTAPDAAPDVEPPPSDFRTPPPPADALPPFGELPPPPRVREAPPSGKGGQKGRWQDQYAAFGDQTNATPREATCLYIASLWHGGLVQISEALKEADIEPIVNVDKMRGVLVLATDELLPPEAVATPAMIAGAGTTALLAQRLIRAKEVKAAQDKKKAAEEYSSSRSVYVPPEPPPPPDPEPERAVEVPPEVVEPPPPRRNSYNPEGLL